MNKQQQQQQIHRQDRVSCKFKNKIEIYLTLTLNVQQKKETRQILKHWLYLFVQ